MNTTFTGPAVGGGDDRVRGIAPEELEAIHAATSQRRPVRHEGSPLRQSQAVRGGMRASIRALVRVHVILAEPSQQQSARGEVVERAPEPIPSEEPTNAHFARASVNAVAVDRERRQLGLDERGRVERLLVAKPRCGLVAPPAEVPRQPEHARSQAAFVAEPRQRGEPELDRFRPSKGGTSDEQRLRESRIVVRQRFLEPVPFVIRVLRVRVLFHAAVQERAPVVVEPVRVEPGEAERRVGGSAMGDLAVERLQERLDQSLCGVDERRRPGSRENLAERQDRAPNVVADVRRVEPAPVVAHEVPHACSAFVACIVEERDRAVQNCRPAAPVRRSMPSATTARRATSSTQYPVARFGIAPLACWTMPQSSTRQKVIGTCLRQVDAADGDRRAPGGSRNRLAEDDRSCFSDRGPLERLPEASRLGAGLLERLGGLDVLADRSAERRRIAEVDEGAGAGGQEVLRIPVGRRDGRAARCEREREQSRTTCSRFAYGVTKMSVAASRSDEPSTGEEAIVEGDVRFEIRSRTRGARAGRRRSRRDAAQPADASGRR